MYLSDEINFHPSRTPYLSKEKSMQLSSTFLYEHAIEIHILSVVFSILIASVLVKCYTLASALGKFARSFFNKLPLEKTEESEGVSLAQHHALDPR